MYARPSKTQGGTWSYGESAPTSQLMKQPTAQIIHHKKKSTLKINKIEFKMSIANPEMPPPSMAFLRRYIY